MIYCLLFVVTVIWLIRLFQRSVFTRAGRGTTGPPGLGTRCDAAWPWPVWMVRWPHRTAVFTVLPHRRTTVRHGRLTTSANRSTTVSQVIHRHHYSSFFKLTPHSKIRFENSTHFTWRITGKTDEIGSGKIFSVRDSRSLWSHGNIVVTGSKFFRIP